MEATKLYYWENKHYKYNNSSVTFLEEFQIRDKVQLLGFRAMQSS